MSFGSEPGRDDGSLPPVNVVIPDDARELERDVLAYRRELRAKRRRQRFARILGPLRTSEFGGHAAIIPLIAACLAVCLVGGAVLSVATMTPASAPTVSAPSQPAPSGELSELPLGIVQLDGRTEPIRSLVTSAIAIIPANCDCGTELSRLSAQAVAAHVGLYFAGGGLVIGQLPSLVARFGDRAAAAVTDSDGVLGAAYRPAGLTVLLVFKDARAEVARGLTANLQLGATLGELKQLSTTAGGAQPTVS